MRSVVTKMTPFPDSGSAVDYKFLKMYHADYTETPEPYCKSKNFPVSFVVPEALPFDPCSDGHLQLPPSIDYNWDKFCPEMCSIIYYIHAEIETGCGEKLHAKKQVRLLPMSPERPPRLWGESGEVQLCDTTQLRMGLLSTKTGRITLQACQEKSLYLPIDARQRREITSIHLDLALEGIETPTKLPQQCQLRATIEAATYLTTSPMSDLPSGMNLQNSTNGQVYRTSLCLWRNKCVGLKWIEKDGQGTGSHQVALVVPVPLPGDISIPPTFYHCYIAREYFMRIEVAIGWSRTLHLKLPLQIYNALEF
ncbi:hypothetical protein N7523_000096 [Penicillium sp. IBT 18751x]|nr:hypothetical protein N7523_000096 [Penicillium sp. IBT 18751x]